MSSVVKNFDPDERITSSVRVRIGLAQMMKGAPRGAHARAPARTRARRAPIIPLTRPPPTRAPSPPSLQAA